MYCQTKSFSIVARARATHLYGQIGQKIQMVSESEYKCQNGETVFWKCDDILCFDDCFNSTWKK